MGAAGDVNLCERLNNVALNAIVSVLYDQVDLKELFFLASQQGLGNKQSRRKNDKKKSHFLCWTIFIDSPLSA